MVRRKINPQDAAILAPFSGASPRKPSPKDGFFFEETASFLPAPATQRLFKKSCEFVPSACERSRAVARCGTWSRIISQFLIGVLSSRPVSERCGGQKR